MSWGSDDFNAGMDWANIFNIGTRNQYYDPPLNPTLSWQYKELRQTAFNLADKIAASDAHLHAREHQIQFLLEKLALKGVDVERLYEPLDALYKAEQQRYLAQWDKIKIARDNQKEIPPYTEAPELPIPRY